MGAATGGVRPLSLAVVGGEEEEESGIGAFASAVRRSSELQTRMSEVLSTHGRGAERIGKLAGGDVRWVKLKVRLGGTDVNGWGGRLRGWRKERCRREGRSGVERRATPPVPETKEET